MSIRTGCVVLVASALALSGCAHVISPEIRAQVNRNLTFRMVLQNPDAHRGATVIWGGVIVDTQNRRGVTDLVVVETPLKYGDFPSDWDSYQGRFIARTRRFLDPAVFSRGAKVTVAGTVAGEETRPLGATVYHYPVIDVRELHLWAPPPPVYYAPPYPPYYPGPWRDGFWCPWPGCF
jgi:outer membrane lipoprotein